MYLARQTVSIVCSLPIGSLVHITGPIVSDLIQVTADIDPAISTQTKYSNPVVVPSGTHKAHQVM
jgi:hypothetical protein